MRKTVIDRLCEQINEANRLTYPMKGYLRFADIKGGFKLRRKVYIITNDQGGVTACHNGATYRETAAKLREVLATQNTY